MATHANMLAWKTPWTEEPGWLRFTGWQRVGHNSVTKHTHIWTPHLCPVLPRQTPRLSSASSGAMAPCNSTCPPRLSGSGRGLAAFPASGWRCASACLRFSLVTSLAVADGEVPHFAASHR